MKKTLGYGFKLKSESFEKALALYGPGGYLKSKKEVLAEIKLARLQGDIGKNSKPKIFKVSVEIL